MLLHPSAQQAYNKVVQLHNARPFPLLGNLQGWAVKLDGGGTGHTKLWKHDTKYLSDKN